jgi:hypothetical protein
MASRELSPLKIPRAWTVREAAALLALHPKKVWRLIDGGVLRGFKQTAYRRLSGPPWALRWTRLYVSSDELRRYMRSLEARYEKELAARRQRRAARAGAGLCRSAAAVHSRPRTDDPPEHPAARTGSVGRLKAVAVAQAERRHGDPGGGER